jgi:putative hydroxymethylpyrimidine transporter CytX
MALLWLGASISISEIFTGGLLAPLGFARGMAAILMGHLVGVALLAAGGAVSFSRRENAMESVAFSLGPWGGRLVALCNVIQLLGWTVVMVVQAGSALMGMTALPFTPAALALSVLVVVWALILGSPAGRLNDVVVSLLAVLCVVLFAEAANWPAARGLALVPGEGAMSMALGIELSIAMPVSWLPLIGDYASRTEDRRCAVAMPFLGYFAGSVAMYAFGLFVAVRSGLDIFAFVAESRFRVPACAVVVLSTLTTAFLDLYSAAVSSKQLVKTRGDRKPVLVIGLLAVAASVFFPVERYGDFLTGFLTSIGMVFVPVYGVLFLEYLFKRPRFEKSCNLAGVVIALLGMAGYRLFSQYEVWIPTLLTLALVAVLYVPYAHYQKLTKKNHGRHGQTRT